MYYALSLSLRLFECLSGERLSMGGQLRVLRQVVEGNRGVGTSVRIARDSAARKSCWIAFHCIQS
jgi:hypothetical protein